MSRLPLGRRPGCWGTCRRTCSPSHGTSLWTWAALQETAAETETAAEAVEAVEAVRVAGVGVAAGVCCRTTLRGSRPGSAFCSGCSRYRLGYACHTGTVSNTTGSGSRQGHIGVLIVCAVKVEGCCCARTEKTRDQQAAARQWASRAMGKQSNVQTGQWARSPRTRAHMDGTLQVHYSMRWA